MRRLKTQIRKFWLPALLVPFLMTLPALSQSNGDTQECQGTTVDLQGEAVAQKSRTFLSELQAGVSKGDKAKVAAMISYPLLVIRRTGKTRIRTEAQFLSHYDSIFDAHVRKAIADQTAKCLFGNYQGTMIGDGEVWYREQDTGTMKIVTVNTSAGKK